MDPEQFTPELIQSIVERRCKVDFDMTDLTNEQVGRVLEAFALADGRAFDDRARWHNLAAERLMGRKMAARRALSRDEAVAAFGMLADMARSSGRGGRQMSRGDAEAIFGAFADMARSAGCTLQRDRQQPLPEDVSLAETCGVLPDAP